MSVASHAHRLWPLHALDILVFERSSLVSSSACKVCRVAHTFALDQPVVSDIPVLLGPNVVYEPRAPARRCTSGARATVDSSWISVADEGGP